MNAEFEKYWKSSRASDRPFAETNAQILDKMIAKTHFLAGAATGYANGVAVMKERCAEVCQEKADEVREEGITTQELGFMVQDYEECAAAIRRME